MDDSRRQHGDVIRDARQTAIRRNLGPVLHLTDIFVAALHRAAVAGDLGAVHDRTAEFVAALERARADVLQNWVGPDVAGPLEVVADSAETFHHSQLIGTATERVESLAWGIQLMIADRSTIADDDSSWSRVVQDADALDRVLHEEVFTEVLRYEKGQIRRALAPLAP